MKDIVIYLKESLETNPPSILEDDDQTIRLNDFQAFWDVKDPENHSGTFVLSIPEDYTDDDLNQYLQDVYMEYMPCDEDLSKKLFGSNADHIIDARFEYDSKEKVNDNSKHVTLEYDKSKDNADKGTDDNITKYVLKNLRLAVDWEYFDVANTSDDGLQDDIWEIFRRTQSSNNVKYMNGNIKLTMTEKNLVYDNGKSELVKDN